MYLGVLSGPAARRLDLCPRRAEGMSQIVGLEKKNTGAMSDLKTGSSHMRARAGLHAGTSRTRRWGS